MATGHSGQEVSNNEYSTKRNKPPTFKEKKNTLLSKKSSLISHKKELNLKKSELFSEKKSLDEKLRQSFSDIATKSEHYNKIKAPLQYCTEPPLDAALRRLQEYLRVNNFEPRKEARIVAEIDKLNRNRKELTRLNDAKKDLDEEKTKNTSIKRQLSETKEKITAINADIDLVNKELDDVSNQLVPILSQPPRSTSGKSPQTPANSLANSFSSVVSKVVTPIDSISASSSSTTPISPVTSVSFATKVHSTLMPADPGKTTTTSSISQPPVRPATLPLRETAESANCEDHNDGNKCLTVPNIPTHTFSTKPLSETPGSYFRIKSEEFPEVSSGSKVKGLRKINRSSTTPNSYRESFSRGDHPRSRLDVARRLLNDLEALPIPKMFTPTTPQSDAPPTSQTSTPTSTSAQSSINRRKGHKGHFRRSGLTIPMCVFSSMSELDLPIPSSWSDLQHVKSLVRQLLKDELFQREENFEACSIDTSMASSGLGTPSLLRSISNTSTAGDSAFSEIPTDNSLAPSPTAFLNHQLSFQSSSSNNSKYSPPQSTIVASSSNSEDSQSCGQETSSQQLSLLIIPERQEMSETAADDGNPGEPGSSSLSDSYDFN